MWLLVKKSTGFQTANSPYLLQMSLLQSAEKETTAVEFFETDDSMVKASYFARAAFMWNGSSPGDPS